MVKRKIRLCFLQHFVQEIPGTGILRIAENLFGSSFFQNGAFIHKQHTLAPC